MYGKLFYVGYLLDDLNDISEESELQEKEKRLMKQNDFIFIRYITCNSIYQLSLICCCWRRHFEKHLSQLINEMSFVLDGLNFTDGMT